MGRERDKKKEKGIGTYLTVTEARADGHRKETDAVLMVCSHSILSKVAR